MIRITVIEDQDEYSIEIPPDLEQRLNTMRLHPRTAASSITEMIESELNEFFSRVYRNTGALPPTSPEVVRLKEELARAEREHKIARFRRVQRQTPEK